MEVALTSIEFTSFNCKSSWILEYSLHRVMDLSLQPAGFGFISGCYEIPIPILPSAFTPGPGLCKAQRRSRWHLRTERARLGAFLKIQWLRIHLSMQGTRVWSLIWELISHKPCDTDQKKKKKKEREKVSAQGSAFQGLTPELETWFGYYARENESRGMEDMSGVSRSQS